ncbi:MAG: hypothetical protein COW01_03600 [Bdellovibrionales bacterium CG12_big_fil_rev_8_21_14_0_65_38_15]|nr:MAG: hypothetical protein COW79_12175 [Bdellovibrionales bacterium CG22_combo_CG10-13_8_21_14_all_38_13]PIQ56787.1 MAG: hypothetical protein COW01_03600 [Bdellovibrionales bacterium CG12_big_fil_rev_8_21_14_0_65_38_15]
MTYLKAFNRSLHWIEKFSINGQGIAVSSKQKKQSYPEVSGYLIPSLISIGERKRALVYANWLKSVQGPSGSWTSPDGTPNFFFDSGQILKGLISAEKNFGGFRDCLKKLLDWMISVINDDGSIASSDVDAWAGEVPTEVLLYSLAPMLDALILLGYSSDDPAFEKIDTAKNRMIRSLNPLPTFNCLSHFHAYIIEGLIDLGEIELAEAGLESAQKMKKLSGAIPCYPNEIAVCSTGLFQYALCYFKLGDLDEGKILFNEALKLQNRSGGWYGSYGKDARYFAKSEIPWAVKYFFDSLNFMIKLEFEKMSHIFPTDISVNDDRYKAVRDLVSSSKKSAKVLDLGCGKGRYLKNLCKEYPELNYYGVDLSEKVMSYIADDVVKKQGSITEVPYADNFFDIVVCNEALEHAMNVKGAIAEIHRVLKIDGKVIIIDKNKRFFRKMKILKWEQWFSSKDMIYILKQSGFEVNVLKNLSYENSTGADGLFSAWIGTK